MNHSRINEIISFELKMQSFLDPKKLKDIFEYLQADEYGIAFEYFFLEVIESKEKVFFSKREEIRKAAIYLELDKKPINDGLFWEKLLEYILNK